MNGDYEDDDSPFGADPAEAAEAQAAAAARLLQLSGDLQAKGALPLPPEGHHALSNTHRIFRTSMDVVGYMNPEHVDNKAAGLRALLDEQLFRYLDDHQAILMAYELHDIQADRAFLHPEPPPLLTVHAVADVTTFEPSPGDIVCGVVRKVSHNSITLLVLGCISVAIERANIPKDWEYDMHSHCWVAPGQYSKAISRGDLVQCMLLSYPKLDPEQEEVLFNLEGSLLPPHTGLASWQWPRQQRLRQLLAAHHGQGKPYSEAQEQHWQQQQTQLRQQGLTRRKLVPIADLTTLQQQQQGSESEDGGGELGDLQQQEKQGQKQKKRKDKQQQQQQNGEQQQDEKGGKVSQKAAGKQAEKEEKARAKAEAKAAKKAAKAAEKAAEKAARKAEKSAAKAAKRGREQQPDAAAAAAEDVQPKAKKQKKERDAAAAAANGHAAAAVAADQQQQQKGGKQKPDKQKSSEKGGSSSKKQKQQ